MMPLRVLLIAAGAMQGGAGIATVLAAVALLYRLQPHVRDVEGLRRFWAWWDAMFARLDRLGVRAASLAEVLAAAERFAAPSAGPA